MILVWTAVLLFAAAAGRDLGWRLIDNRLVVGLILAWGGYAALSGWEWSLALAHVGVAVLAFAICLSLGLLGWMGGGDVKLAAAVFLWAGPSWAIEVLALVAVAGLALAVVGVIAAGLERLSPPAWIGRGLGLLSATRGVPYGVALALGGAVAVLLTPMGGNLSGG